MEEGDAMGSAFGGEVAGLVEQFLGEIERGNLAVTHFPKSDRDAAGAATGLEQTGVAMRKEAFDQLTLRLP